MVMESSIVIFENWIAADQGCRNANHADPGKWLPQAKPDGRRRQRHEGNARQFRPLDAWFGVLPAIGGACHDPQALAFRALGRRGFRNFLGNAGSVHRTASFLPKYAIGLPARRFSNEGKT
jgi:hypothetical protein